MEQFHRKDTWAGGAAYEQYIGRWSRLVAREFVAWLNVPFGARWLDVGCGTGALSQIILESASPGEVIGIDPSEGYIAYAREHIPEAHARFVVGDAQALPIAEATYDAVAAGLVLNFVPDPNRALTEMRRMARACGTVAAYVWDYACQMQLLRSFWDAAVALDPAALPLDEGHRFAICKRELLAHLFRTAGLQGVEARSIDVATIFRDFEDYWSPFLGGQGPAPGYTMSLSQERRTALREYIRARLPIAADGSIPLMARAWAVRGYVNS
jgi:SAM-dependent methyltransferase